MTWSRVTRPGSTWSVDAGSTPAPEPPATGTPLSVTLSPETVSGTRIDAGTVVSDTATATASGGTEPWSYAWTARGGDPLSITAQSSPTTAFSAVLANGETLS